MANIFKNVTSANVTTLTTIYTVPAGETNIVVGLTLANVHNASNTISAKVAGVHLVKSIPLPAGSTIELLDGKIVLTPGDTVTVESASGVDCIFSFMQELDT